MAVEPGQTRDVFLARLAAPLPSPGFNMVRYYGALANGHHLNQSIRPRTKTTQVQQLSLFELRRNEAVPLRPGRTALAQALLEPTPRRLSWGKLLGRVFQIDVEVCAKCGGPMRVLEAVTEPTKIATVRPGARPPPRRSPPGQTLLFQP